MGSLLKGQVQSPKFTTAEITDSDNRIHYVPIKHVIDDYFLAKIDGKHFAFSMKNARILTHRSDSGLGSSFQVIQYDTCHYSSLSPTIKELELLIESHSLPKMDKTMHNMFSVLARREKKNFGKFLVGERKFDTEEMAQEYLDGLKEEFKNEEVYNTKTEKTEKVPLKIIHNVHEIDELYKIFAEEEGEFPDQVREIKKYLNELDINQIVTPLRRITEFIHDDLRATVPTFLAQGVDRANQLDGTLRDVTNVARKPKGNMMKYMLIIMPIVIGILIVGMGFSEGWFDGIIAFTDNLGTIQEGFKDTGIGSIGSIQYKNQGGVDYSDNAIRDRYPDCHALQADIDAGVMDYDKLSSLMQGFIDTCDKVVVTP